MTTDGPENACSARYCETCAARARRERTERETSEESPR